MARTTSQRRKQYCFRFNRRSGQTAVFSSTAFSMSEALDRLRACFPDAKEIQVVRHKATPRGMVSRTQSGVSYLAPVACGEMAESLRTAARDFMHLLKVGESIGWADLAQRIRSHYDTTEPRIAEVVRACERVAA